MIYGSQKVEVTPVAIVDADKQNVVYKYNGKAVSLKRGRGAGFLTHAPTQVDLEASC